MTLAAQVVVDIKATKTAQSGLTSSVDQHPLSISVSVGDCSKVWSDRRAVGAFGFDDIDFSTLGVSAVKLLCVKNLSSSDMALSAGYNGVDFRNFIVDTLAWNFAPMINLGSLTLRGMPIRAGGSYLLSCPNSSGFATTSGGSRLRIGGVSGSSYEIFVMGN
jgi:hypothetical protein